MSITWTTTRDALTAALASAASGDRGAIIEARDALSSLGARYDAAVAAGELAALASASPGSAVAAVVAWQSTGAAGALDHACRYLESLPGVDAGTFYLPAESLDATAADATPRAAALNWYLTVGAWTSSTGESARAPTLRVESLIPGAEGNRLAVRLYRDAGVPSVEVLYRGRSVRTRVGIGRDGLIDAVVTGLVTIAGSFRAPDLFALGAGAVSLGGGTGGLREAALHRADLATEAGRAVLSRTGASAPTTAQRASLELAVARVTALRGFAGGAGASLERELAGALDAAARLLSYLAGP